jgi:hypothetical protein
VPCIGPEKLSTQSGVRGKEESPKSISGVEIVSGQGDAGILRIMADLLDKPVHKAEENANESMSPIADNADEGAYRQ